MYQIIQTDWQTHEAELTDIRTQVFIEEQHVPVADEWDGLDADAIHFIMLDDETAIGCARIVLEANNPLGRFHIGRVSLKRPYRSQGLGHSLVHFLVEYCQATDANAAIFLHAQSARQKFYGNLGFVAQGEEFMDAGIPHITMRRAPNAQ